MDMQIDTGDQALRTRALQVVPGGMYGHMRTALLPAGYPQFFERGEGLSHLGCRWPSLSILRPSGSVQGIVFSVVTRNPIESQPTEITQPFLSQTLTGSFWCGSVPMAAAFATLEELERIDGPATMHAMGTPLREGLAEQGVGVGVGVGIRQSGPPQMPTLMFDEDPACAKGFLFLSGGAKAWRLSASAA